MRSLRCPSSACQPPNELRLPLGDRVLGTSNWSAGVCSPRNASSAALAVNCGEWFRLSCLIGICIGGNPPKRPMTFITYRAVQKAQTGSAHWELSVRPWQGPARAIGGDDCRVARNSRAPHGALNLLDIDLRNSEPESLPQFVGQLRRTYRLVGLQASNNELIGGRRRPRFSPEAQ